MPAARNCRSCGAPLPGDVRWCGRCHEPVREFTPRAPLHAAGSVAGPLIHGGGHAPHWSRWERSATTFGPLGRVVASALLFGTIPVAWSFGFFLYLLVFPLVAIPVLGSIWARGWVVPGETPAPPVAEPAFTPPPETPATHPELAWRVVSWGLLVGACLAIAYGPPPLQAATLGVGALVGMYAFWRGFLTR